MAVDAPDCAVAIAAHNDEPTIESSPSTPHFYQIDESCESESAIILFARQLPTSERIVIKLLHKYRDTRYSLETVSERQQCQLEALERNRVFTPEVYSGLARIHELDLDQRYILLDETITHPTQAMLDPEAEYALMMDELPEERRLDRLLKEESEDVLLDYMRLLSKDVAHMHTDLAKPLAAEDEMRWGSYEQLHSKLLHNLGLLDLVLTTGKLDQRCTLGLPQDMLCWLKKTILQVFTESYYRSYFEQRVQTQWIKRCHGDLKSANLWILPKDSGCNGEPSQYVKILDAIDFNPSYSNIDILSDFAMLVIDIQTRTELPSLANEMVDYYLRLTGQDNQAARAVLSYYLVEKAIVGTAISIVYDDLPVLGLNLLNVATMHLKCLVEHTFYFDGFPRSIKPCPRTAMM